MSGDKGKAVFKKSNKTCLKDAGAKIFDCFNKKFILNDFTIDQLRDIALWTWADGRIFIVNEQACSSLGYTRDELLSMSIPDIDVNFQPDALSKFIEQNRHRGHVLMESRLKTKDGRTFPVEINSNYFQAGDKEYMVSLCRDITKRKYTEEALLESEKKYRSLVEHVNDWVWEVDTDGKYSYASPRVRDLLGYEPDDMTGTSPLDYMAPEESERVRVLLTPVFMAHEEFSLFESTLIKKDGSAVTLETSGIPVFDAHGAFKGYRGSDRDITRRKQAEEALRKSEEKYRIVADNTYDWEFWLSPEGQVLYTSPSCELITGYSAQELAKYPGLLFDITHPEDKHVYLAHAHARQPHSHNEFELRIINKRAETRWIHHICQPVYDREGHFLGYRGSNRDITERKQAEEALQENESRLKQTERILYRSQEAGKVGSWYLDLRNNDLWWSPETYRMFGLPPDTKLSYESFLSMVYKDDRANVDHAWQAALAGASYDIEHRIVVEGQVKWVHEKAVLDFDGHGIPIFGIGTVTDITERKRAGEALRESEEKFKTIFGKAAMGIAITDMRGRIIDCNSAYQELLGYSKEELREKRLIEFTYPGDVDKNLGLQRQLADGTIEKYTIEKRYVRKDRRLIWVRLTVSAIRNPDGSLKNNLAVVEDITERKRAEEALQDAKDEVELYVDLMGHDINNMNQVSLGFLELAHNIISIEGKLGEDKIVLLEKAMDSLKNSSQLIDNVRKLQREKMGLYEPEVLDICGVIEEVVKQFLDIPVRDIKIACKFSGNSYVRANALLKDVFVNLVGNAIKHSRGPVTINIGVSTVMEGDKKYYRTDVEDNGPGIPDSLKHTLFDRLNLTATRAKGKGFGLCLIKMLVDDYQGKFWVEDRIQGDFTKGAKFVVMLPAAEK